MILFNLLKYAKPHSFQCIGKNFFQKKHIGKYMYAKVYPNTSFKLMESCKMKELCAHRVCVCCGQNPILENWMLLIYVLYVDRKCKAVVSFLLGARDKIMCDSFGCVFGGVLHKITLTLVLIYTQLTHTHGNIICRNGKLPQNLTHSRITLSDRLFIA